MSKSRRTGGHTGAGHSQPHPGKSRFSLREKHFWGLIGWLAVTAAAAAVGAQFMPGAWYGSLAKPAWTPPPWLFAPVWTALYLAMAVAAWLVWCRGGFRRSGAALGLYLLQLVFNAAWSWLFFGLMRPGAALVDILVLLALVAGTTVLFWRRRRDAGMLFLPYLAWVAFATALNFGIWAMN